jgi:hypothetical protein
VNTSEPTRSVMAERIHALIKATAPELALTELTRQF